MRWLIQSNHGNAEEMDVGEENHVVVVGLAAAPMQNVAEQMGEQVEVEVEGNAGAGTNPNAPDV